MRTLKSILTPTAADRRELVFAGKLVLSVFVCCCLACCWFGAAAIPDALDMIWGK